MRAFTFLALAALVPFAGCTRVDLPEDPTERAALCAAATSLALGGAAERNELEPIAFEQVEAVSHYILLAGVREGGGFDEGASVTAMGAVDGLKRQLIENRTAAATARQCRAAYPAVTARPPFALPEEDLEAIAGCYQLAVIMGDFYLQGGAGQSYAEAPDLNLLIFNMQRRFEADPANTALAGQEAVETLQRRGMNTAVTAGPPAKVLEACQQRFATAVG